MALNEVTAGHLQELRRGTVELACLALLRRPDNGHALLETLNRQGIRTEADTLYALLRRLEEQGLLTREGDEDATPDRALYSTSGQGGEVARVLIEDWRHIEAAINRLVASE